MSNKSHTSTALFYLYIYVKSDEWVILFIMFLLLFMLNKILLEEIHSKAQTPLLQTLSSHKPPAPRFPQRTLSLLQPTPSVPLLACRSQTSLQPRWTIQQPYQRVRILSPPNPPIQRQHPTIRSALKGTTQPIQTRLEAKWPAQRRQTRLVLKMETRILLAAPRRALIWPWWVDPLIKPVYSVLSKIFVTVFYRI